MYNKIIPIIFSIIMILILSQIAYEGVYLQSIHINDRKSNLNVDGITAVYVGLVALILDIYICYISIKEFWKK